MKINWPNGIDENSFLQHYWQQKPLLMRQAFADFDNPVDPDELAGLACDQDSSSRFMQQVNEDEWRMCMGPLADDFFDDVTGNAWSLLVSDVEKLLPDFRDYLQPFRFIPDWRIDDLMISYAPVGGSVGAHVDQYDVFLLQASGVREWQIESTPRQGQQKSISSTISLLGDFSSDQTLSLKAGDMLYLPPQFAHHGVAREEPCMTWSIGFRAPSIDEMLPCVLNYLIDDNPQANHRFTDSKRQATTEPGRISPDDLNQLRLMLQNALQQDNRTLSQWIGRYLTEPKTPADDIEILQTHWTELKKLLSKQAALVCNSHQHFMYSDSDGEVQLFADGQRFACSRDFAEKLCSLRRLNSTDILTSEDQQVALALYRRQSLIIETYETH